MSTFRLPSVIVYQELLTTTVVPTTPFMNLCIVGPVYQVENKVEIDPYKLSEEDYTSNYVGQTLGSVIDTNSVYVSLSDIYVKVWPKVAETLSSTMKVDNSDAVTKITGDTSLELSDAVIKVGDYIDITYTKDGVSLTYTSMIQEVSADGKTLTLKRNLPTPEGDATITGVVKRPIPETDVLLESRFIKAEEDVLTITHGATVTSTVVDTPSPVVSANVALSYRALRKDIAGDFSTITSQSVSEATIGPLDINNPMSVAASIVSSAVGDISYSILPIETDDNNGYIKALDILSSAESVYVIVPLTTDKDVISAYATHCTTLSTAERSMWRIMYANMPMPTTKVMVEINEGALSAGLDENSCYVKDIPNGAFITNNVRVTDFVDIYDNESNAYQYSLQVLDVLNDSVATVSTTKWTKTSEGYASGSEKVTELEGDEAIKYEVVRVLDTQGIADAVAGVAESFKNKRLRYVQPDTIMLNVNGVDELVTGEYLCVALGAMRAGFPPHQGFSTMGISGIKRVLNANKKFTYDQLETMAGAGVFWVVQDEPEELPYVLYQTTTDNTQLETREDSCVAVVDYASKYLKINLKNVLGRYNVNTISKTLVTNTINTCLDTMVSTSYQYIGPILTGGQLTGIVLEADKIKPTVKIEIPYPVNGVDITLQV